MQTAIRRGTLTKWSVLALGAACFGILAGALPVRAEGGGTAQDKAAIQSAVQKMDAASNRKDAAAYSAFLHPQFVNINMRGQETVSSKAEQQAQLTQAFGQASQVFQKSTIRSITFSPAGALVDQSSRNMLAFLQGKRTLKMTGGGHYHDLWVKSGGVWLEKRSQAVSEQYFINGKEVK